MILFDTNESIFSSHLPSNINVSYIFDKNYFYLGEEIYQNRKKNILNRVKEKIFKINKKRKIKSNIYNSLLKGNYDLVISFSEHFDQYLPFNKFSIPFIRWVHLGINFIDLSKRRINIFKKYSYIISISNEMKNQLESLGIDEEKIFMLYNPINIRDIQLKSRYKSEIKLPSNSYMVQVARLVNVKRHSDLIDIFAVLVDKGIQEDLYIIGRGSEYHHLKSKITQLNLEKRCFLLGEMENPYPYMKNARLFLYTSEREGLPTVLLESMALGVPVVAMDCPTGPKDILGADSEYGKLVPMNNKEMFVDAVMELLNNNTLWLDYSSKSLVRIQDFSTDKIAQQVDAVFRQIVKKNM